METCLLVKIGKRFQQSWRQKGFNLFISKQIRVDMQLRFHWSSKAVKMH